MSTQAISRGPVAPVYSTDKARSVPTSEPTSQGQKQTTNPVFIPPNEFRMKLLKRILSVDGTIDNKALQKLQKTSSERTLQANILFQNGDVGTLISFDRVPDENENENPDATKESELPAIQPQNEKRRERRADGEKVERPLKLPPIMLPPIYTLTPRPLIFRDYSGPPNIPPPPCEDDWEDLEDCRYLRPAQKRFRTSKESKSFLLTNNGSNTTRS